MEVFQSREEGREGEGEREEGEEGEREEGGEREREGGDKEIVKQVATYFPGKLAERIFFQHKVSAYIS